MPPFMYRSGGGSGAGGGGSAGGGGGGGYSQQPLNPARPRSQPGAQSHYEGPPIPMQQQQQQQPPAYQGGGGGGGPPPGHRGRGPPPRGGRQDDRQSSLPYIEPEVALLQRPIIKEEELERMEAIAKDEGWAKHDEIDYNAKLNLSDDESVDGPMDSGPGPKHDHSKDKEHQNNRRAQQKAMDEDNRAGESKFSFFFFCTNKYEIFEVTYHQREPKKCVERSFLRKNLVRGGCEKTFGEREWTFQQDLVPLLKS